MKIRFIKDASGIKAGKEGDYPAGIAKPLIEMGIAEEIKSVKKAEPKKEAAPEMETKEEKTVSKRRTKSKK